LGFSLDFELNLPGATANSPGKIGEENGRGFFAGFWDAFAWIFTGQYRTLNGKSPQGFTLGAVR
jgi:hypothetical protein